MLKLTRIPNEKIREVKNSTYDKHGVNATLLVSTSDVAIAQVQLEADQEKLPTIKQEVAQEIFGEIEKHIKEMRLWSMDSTNFNSEALAFIREMEADIGWWQSLKQRMGVK